MGLRQLFSTIVYSWDGDLSAEVVTLSRSDAYDSRPFEDLTALLEALEFDPTSVTRLSQQEGMAIILATYFEAADASEAALRDWSEAARRSDILSREANWKYQSFAEELLRSSRIPIEESPLTAVPLETLVVRATWFGLSGLGAYLAAGQGPVFIIVLPFAIILVGAATGIGEGLREGLRDKVKKLLTGKRPPRPGA